MRKSIACAARAASRFSFAPSCPRARRSLPAYFSGSGAALGTRDDPHEAAGTRGHAGTSARPVTVL